MATVTVSSKFQIVIPTEVRERHVGKIISIWEVPDHEVAVPEEARTRDWVLQIAYAMLPRLASGELFRPDGNQIRRGFPGHPRT